MAIRWLFMFGALCLGFAFAELPSKGTLVGTALCVAGAVTSIVWK